MELADTTVEHATGQVGQVGAGAVFRFVVGRLTVRISAEMLIILSQICGSFRQTLQTSTGIVGHLRLVVYDSLRAGK
jgi:hypothetical protein